MLNISFRKINRLPPNPHVLVGNKNKGGGGGSRDSNQILR